MDLAGREVDLVPADLKVVRSCSRGRSRRAILGGMEPSDMTAKSYQG